MTPLPLRLLAVGLALQTNWAAGLKFAPGSQCEVFCTSADEVVDSKASTSRSDIVCEDDRYSTTEEGQRFEACVNCLKDSDHTNGTESDLSSLLYNFRFAVDTCLFDDERTKDRVAAEISGCLAGDACLSLNDALVFDSFEPNTTDVYGYCTADGKAFVGKQMRSCLTCLKSSVNHVVLSNFMVVLTGGCAYTPAAGETLRLTGDLFSDEKILIQAPDSGRTGDNGGLGPGPPAGLGDETASSPGLSREFIIGIVVGISVLFGIAITLFFVYYLRFRGREPTDVDSDEKYDDGHPTRGTRALRHQASIDPDPSPFNTLARSVRGYRYGDASGTDSECEGGYGYGHNSDYFDYLHATAMMHRPEAEGQALPTHAAYNPYIKSRNHFAGPERGPVADGSTVRTGSAAGGFMSGRDAVDAREERDYKETPAPRDVSRAPSSTGLY